MKCITWNVNGLRACLNKGFLEAFTFLDADIFCIQETKMQPGQAELEPSGYLQYWNSAQKKGYAGTAMFCREQPLSVEYGIGIEHHDQEGRVITAEFPDFYFLNVYTPNSRRELIRLDYRTEWEQDFRAYLRALDERKPLILCGDLNVAHTEIDLKNPRNNVNNAGFTPQERDAMTRLLDTGFVDAFRYLYPDRTGAYTWWSYMYNARKNNAGWRIDYFIVSDRIKSQIKNCIIHDEIFGSDHCPLELQIF